MSDKCVGGFRSLPCSSSWRQAGTRATVKQACNLARGGKRTWCSGVLLLHPLFMVRNYVKRSHTITKGRHPEICILRRDGGGNDEALNRKGAGESQCKFPSVLAAISQPPHPPPTNLPTSTLLAYTYPPQLIRLIFTLHQLIHNTLQPKYRVCVQ